MKRSLVSIAMAVWGGLMVLSAQFPSSLGVKAGISFANQSYRLEPIDYKLDTKPVAGPVFTIFAEAFKGDHFSLQLDLSYLLKGSKTKTESVTVDHVNHDRILVNEGAMRKSTFTYLSIAPVARYRLGQGPLQASFLLGPRADILLKYDTDSEYPLNDQNSLIPGLTLGAGLEYGLNNLGVFAELQYQGDMMPVTGQDPLLVNNHLLSLTLGIRWLAAD